jgi:hypothetical protein
VKSSLRSFKRLPGAGPQAGPGLGRWGPWHSPWPWLHFFLIFFLDIFGFAYVLHIFLGVSCFAHVLV